MTHCLLCRNIFENKKALSYHIRSSHKITSRKYKELCNLIAYCEICNKEIDYENKSKRCNFCRDRTGINNPFFNKHHSDKTIKFLSSICRKKSEEKWKNESYRSKVIKGTSKPRKESFKKEQSPRIKKWFKDNPEQRLIRSIQMKKSWNDGSITKNGYSSNTSGLEKSFFEEIKKINESFEKNITIKINKKWFFPDVIDNKRKLIIEYFGDYYHCNPEEYDENYFNDRVKLLAKEIWKSDNNRIKLLQNNGYDVIVVWEKHFKKDKDSIIEKIKTYLV